MTKKICFYLLICILFILNIVLDMNINNYIHVLENCFNKNIILNNFYYSLICFIIGLISILIIISIKLIIFYKKDEIKGIKFKSEDGTFGTSNWNENIEEILGKNDAKGLILGKKGNEIIKLPFESHFNKNIAVFGSSR